MLLTKDNKRELTTVFDYELSQIATKQAAIEKLRAEIEELKQPILNYCISTGLGVQGTEHQASYTAETCDKKVLDTKALEKSAPSTFSDLLTRYGKDKAGTKAHITVK